MSQRNIRVKKVDIFIAFSAISGEKIRERRDRRMRPPSSVSMGIILNRERASDIWEKGSKKDEKYRVERGKTIRNPKAPKRGPASAMISSFL